MVSGADGFLGSRLVQTLASGGAQVFAQVRSKQTLKRLKFLAGFTLLEADLDHSDLSFLVTQIPAGVDAIIHAAAAGVKPGDDDRDRLMAVNVGGTRAMLDVALKVKARRFVYIGSSFEYGDGNDWKENAEAAPLNVYGESKYMAWQFVQDYGRMGLNIVGLRPFYMYGEGEASYRLIPSVIAAIKDHMPLDLTAGEQERDFIYIDDAVRAILTASIKSSAVGQLLNICSGQPVTIRQAVEELVKISGKKAKIRFGAVPYREKEWMRLSGSPVKAAKLLGFKASIGLSEGLKKALAHAR